MGLLKCVFCRKPNSRKSEEDVFARWIAREYNSISPPNKRGFWELNPENTSVNSKRKPFKVGARAGKLGLVSRAPCEKCNNGWMSVLENDAKTVLAPMIRGVSLSLLPKAQLVVAKWLLKTAIMHELLQDKGEYRYFKPRDRYGLYKEGSIPPYTAMFLARYVGKNHLHVGYDGIRTLPLHLSLIFNDDPSHPANVDGYSLTFRINQLTLQIFTARWSEEFNRPVGFSIKGEWTNATIQIWPLFESRTWPPPLTIGDDFIGSFEQRWVQ